MTKTDTTNWAEPIGRNAFLSIAEMVAELKNASNDDELDAAQTRIQEDALSVEIGGWWQPGGDAEPTEYRILLATGGPAVRIVGELDQYCEPDTAHLEVQDWFKPWTEYPCDDTTLLAYASQFRYGQ